MPKKELPKSYNPAEYEDAIYKKWEESGFFNPDNLDGKPYSIMMPPPNVTGVLHLGHALENTLMDIMARYQRMRGKKVLLLPGTDHAAVATQAKVEKILIEQGIKNPRQELGREKLLEKIREYSENSKATILQQIKKMGTSCDWSRLAYTFDKQRSRAVNEMFVKMYNDGLIYRGKRIVNWDAKLQTTISDDEIVWQEEKVPFYYLKYGPFIIATARPETKFGDKYVVMHPDDKRYKKYKHGEKFECEWINGKVMATVIKDDVIDMKFGTGVMTITPWHDMVDFDIAERHKLNGEQIIDFYGKLMPVAGEFAGMDILTARPKIAEKLQAKGLVEKVEENYVHRVAKGDRSNGLVEPQIKEQWFVAVNKKIPGRNKSLKDLMREAVTVGHKGDKKQIIKITPERFTKSYLGWIDNLRDWCISRQIWWGHRIPVYYRKQKKQKAGVEINYFVHGTSLDNEKSLSSGHADTALSKLGIKQSHDLKNIVKEKFDAVFCSDLKRARQTAEIVFGKNIIIDKRLREIDYGKLTRQSETKVKALMPKVIDKNFPDGESYQDVENRIRGFLDDIGKKYAGKKIAIVAHQAPQLALEVIINGKSWPQAMSDDWRNKKAWQPGWKYIFDDSNTANKEIYVGVEAPKGGGWKQDEDTLDTWFSSGLWTFSTLGWPKKTKDLKTFHPTSWMQMGYEILFFWMARMILMSTYALDEIPFKDVYIHGILRDESGKKFSKSAGNSVDPLEVINEFGTDALRFSTVAGISPGSDSRFYEEKIQGARNLVNKLWNVSRYIIGNWKFEIGNLEINKRKLTLADQWILGKILKLVDEVTNDMENYRFAQAGEKLRQFTWDDLADWYIEAAKFETGDEKEKILTYVLIILLKLWHPFLPFVTETIWREINDKKLLMICIWPSDLAEVKDMKKKITLGHDFELIKQIITAIRNARSVYRIEPSKKIKAVIYAGSKMKLVESQAELIKKLRTGIGELEIKKVGEKIKNSIYLSVSGVEIFLIVPDFDFKKESARLDAEIKAQADRVKILEKKLANKEFTKKAPVEIVNKEKEKLEMWQQELKKLKEQRINLK